MKKTYIQPSVEAIKIKAKKILMTSLIVDPETEVDTQLGRESDYDWEDEE